MTMIERIEVAAVTYAVEADTDRKGLTWWLVRHVAEKRTVTSYRDHPQAVADCGKRNAWAILDAIREPTSGMVYAGGNSKTARVWRDMIDAALAEG